MAEGKTGLPEFHPQTVLRDWGDGHAFRLSDAQTGVCVFGATGSGKTSGPAKHLAYGYLAEGFGGLVLCAKKEERRQWENWAAECGRSEDLVIVDKSATWRFNFLDWEASRPEEGGGLTINIVNLLDEIAQAISGGNGDKGNEKFWEDALRHMMSNLVDLPVLAGIPFTLSMLSSILNSAPQNAQQLADAEWDAKSDCASALRAAEEATRKADPQIRADYAECEKYWRKEFPNLSEKTRSIIVLMFSMLARSFNTRPLRQIFSDSTNIKPEDTFDGKIIIVDIPVQEFRLVGRMANLAWKYCFQIAVLRRVQPAQGYLRPVFLWADEAQNFVTRFDAEYQAVARSAGGCTVYLTQNRESYRRVLGNADAVDSLLGNLQCKFFCQNTGDTNEWASKLLGERYIKINSTNVSQQQHDRNQDQTPNTSGVSRSEQKRHFVEAATFTTLKRGGPIFDYRVECIVYNGGHLFPSGNGGVLPCKLLTFNQR
jgi:hypothetical protein